VTLEREIDDGTTVKDLLEDIASQNQAFKEVLFDAKTGRLAGHISLILNGRFLELAGGLEAQLRPGDTIRLMPGFSGG
jgi:molybdopterin converting factor small subunit